MAQLDMMTESLIAGKGERQTDVFRMLGLMYATGKGCDRDLVAAHKWLNIAAIKGCEKSAKLRADLAGAMRKDQLAEALREAREWMTIH
ncbi:sel1 repeat family protein [Allorhizobium undicola]|uniref:sel1 repeat family protein n=1 Tax=Allorhizobium undicola TaxID=78527 RepID=UPI000484B758|nr:sel1 repeat family protein [Allorhizobium undicola]